MPVRDQIIQTLWNHGITPRYKGYLPLADLIELTITQQRLDKQLLEQVAQKHDISVSLLLSCIPRLAAKVYYEDYEGFCRLNGSWRYRQMNFVAGLAREAAQF